ncbi:PDZ domain-containing protein 9 isoform X2 [Lissotriton helveticus]
MEGLEVCRNPISGPQQVSSEHTLSTTLQTHLYLDAEGLGVALIQNGPYLQIVQIIDKGAAARNGRLKPGDILIKIGHANVLGCTLREVRRSLANTPVGTGLQIMVYRDLVDIPKEWEDEADLHPEPPQSSIKLENDLSDSEEEGGDN